MNPSLPLVFATLLGAAPLGWAGSQAMPALTPTPATYNAALTFWQAFAAMPELKEADRKLLASNIDQTFDEAAAKAIIEKCRRSMELFAAAARKPQCDWGLDMTLGFHINTDHATKVAYPIYACRLKAKILADADDPAGSVENLITMFRASRMIGTPPAPLFCTLIDRVMSSIAERTAAQLLPHLDDAALQTLLKEMDAMPPPESMEQAFQVEKQLTGYSIENLVGLARKDRSAYEKEIRDLFVVATSAQDYEAEPLFQKLVKADARQLTEWKGGVERCFEEMIRLAQIPYAGYPKGINALRAKIAADGNPLSNLIILGYPSARSKDADMALLNKAFRTVIQIRLNHPANLRAELANIPSPDGNGPMECRDVPGGVELIILKQSNTHPDWPLKLTVGLK